MRLSLSEAAKKLGLPYTTVHQMWRRGELKGIKLPSNRVILYDEEEEVEDIIELYEKGILKKGDMR